MSPLSLIFIALGVLIIAVLFVPQVRRIAIVRPIYKLVRKQKSSISKMEKQALEAGNASFEKGLFTGRPDWKQLQSFPKLALTEEERSIMDGPTHELCSLIDDWDIREVKREIPDSLWNFVRKHKLFGLRVPKERGGLGVSFQTQSLVLGKVASRSVDVATMIELPTSLWPDEIIEKYGTEEQKEEWMPRFADSKEIASFAITGISNGSDATSMRDVGYVEEGEFNGKKVKGVRLNLQKRYITFAPKATILVVGFRLFDKDNHLGKGEDVGITLAIIPANHPGISIGRRHLPTGVAFPNGPIWAEDAFIPLDWIIGGTERAGEGWKMIMECLFVGRAIALPSISVATSKLALRTSAQYARVRRQFGSHIGRFEGIEEPLTKLIEIAYISEAMRSLTCSMVDSGYRPLAVSSLMKYQTTELTRQAVDAAMDIHAGRAVMDGPSNYLMSGFLAVPIGVTVEGANIVTRSIITFAQGIMQTHPFFYKALKACEVPNEKEGLKEFDKAFAGHLAFLLTNIVRAFSLNISGGVLAKAPNNVPARVKAWYKLIWRASVNFAVLADLTTITMAASLKKRQKLGGRLSDALSELFIMSATLKRYEDDGFPEEDYPIVELSMRNSLYRFQRSIKGAIRNFPIVPLRFLFSLVIFPFGGHRKPSNDSLGHKVVQLVLEPGAVLDRLSRDIYVTEDKEDITGRLEVAFKKSVELEPAQKKLDVAIRKGEVRRILGVDWITDAENKQILTKDEADSLRELEELVDFALAVDHFDPKDVRVSKA